MDFPEVASDLQLSTEIKYVLIMSVSPEQDEPLCVFSSTILEHSGTEPSVVHSARSERKKGLSLLRLHSHKKLQMKQE